MGNHVFLHTKMKVCVIQKIEVSGEDKDGETTT